MKVFITKHALTHGIEEVDGDIDGTMITYTSPAGYSGYYHRNDWHLSREDAVEKANKMRIAKIASHRRSIKKLEGLKFDPQD
jgi:hypothetical protein